MRSDRSVAVHIGVPKTGSTGLQTFVHRMRPALEAHGLSVPLTGFVPHGGHRGLLHAARSGPAEALGVLETALGEDESPRVLFTSEDLSDGAVLGNLLEALGRLRCGSVDVILCVRRQDHLLDSMFVQDVAQGVTHADFEDYVAAAIERGFGAFGSIADTVVASGHVDRLHVVDVSDGRTAPADRILRLLLDDDTVDQWHDLLGRRVNARVPEPLWPFIVEAAALAPIDSVNPGSKSPLRRFAEILRERQFPASPHATALTGNDLARDIRASFAAENQLLEDLSGIRIDWAGPGRSSTQEAGDVLDHGQVSHDLLARHVLAAVLQLGWEISNTADRDWDLALSEQEMRLLEDYPWSPGWGAS